MVTMVQGSGFKFEVRCEPGGDVKLLKGKRLLPLGQQVGDNPKVEVVVTNRVNRVRRARGSLRLSLNSAIA